MLWTLVAILCQGPVCNEHILGQMNAMECMVHGQVIAADYIRVNEPGSTLERYKCVSGEYKKAVPS
jgi:hypothetical protein